MQRYKATIEYDGTGFVGWQRQKSGLSIQEVIEEAIEKFTFHDVKSTAAGRTDAGVHALGQVIHFDLANEWNTITLVNAINYHIGRSNKVAVLDIEKVPDSFHARFDAKKKTYIYRICNRMAKPTIELLRAWHVVQKLDVNAMQEATKALLGYHDFTSFKSKASQVNRIMRNLDDVVITRNEDVITISITARSFLHNQVRIIVGTLYEIGRGRMGTDAMREILEAKDRTKAGLTAPPWGLYLESVVY